MVVSTPSKYDLPFRHIFIKCWFSSFFRIYLYVLFPPFLDQDLSQKFVDALNAIAASSLEGSAWFRRSLQVVTQMDQSSDTEESSIQSDSQASQEIPQPVVHPATHAKNSHYSVPALLIMAEYLPIMMDLIYLSEEKDKIAYSLVYLMYNVTPYLKNHSTQNLPGYRACSALLSAVSDFQYTLRAWRKDVYELFLDSDFFQMDLVSLRFWRTIIDRLITYDNTVFKDLMQKIALSQSGAINIFANREQVRFFTSRFSNRGREIN